MSTETHYCLTITLYDRDKDYKTVGELLHNYADHIVLRVGYPISEKNVAVIFLILKISNDDMGALSGKLGQIPSIKVKSISLKI